MKKLFLTLFFLSFCFLIQAQEKPEIGDELVINAPNGLKYNHIAFPKLNFLVKRGKLANYKNVYGNKVIVDEVISEDNGSSYVVLKKKNGKKFFGILSEVKANYNKSIKSGELSTTNP
ncbi:hypothetical protein [Flavivirga eckloniae]|uniref:Dihydroorotase n=1 Tax=Flavivirga eckloniae TaxID=1803846 RepID=A0A2K9PKD9_9FLAO|nr:hypothetical protein [Flavivirga eckloniae]AUP77495.1 hypothetical protein C1H87_01660 [Flavivirga eckloniae]